MNTRIRYVKTEVPGQLVSARNFSSGDTEYKVYLSDRPNLVKFEIVNAVSGQVMYEGTGVSGHNARIKAKKALMSLGVSFAKEERTVSS